jgi:hypothetical protein
VFEAIWRSRFAPDAHARFRSSGRVAGTAERISARRIAARL